MGVLFFAGFGSLWLCTGLSAMHRLNFLSVVGAVAVLALLIFPAIRLLRRAPETNQPGTNVEQQLEMKRVFSRLNIIQWKAIVAAVILLNVFQQ